MKRRSAIALVGFMAALAMSQGCTRSVPSIKPTQRPAAENATNNLALQGAPAWARDDATQLSLHLDAFNRAALAVIASEGVEPTELRDSEAFVRLSTDVAGLSKHGAAWLAEGYDDKPYLVYFDNGISDYPVADGLIYSSSPTTPPTYRTGDSDVPSSVLSTPTPVAPHWWVAAWDPFLFQDAVSYDGRSYFSMGTSMQVDPHTLHGPITTVSGRSVGGVTYEDESNVDINLVDVGQAKPVPVLTNPFTKRHKQKKRGLLVYRVTRATLPGGREIAFALDAWE